MRSPLMVWPWTTKAMLRADLVALDVECAHWRQVALQAQRRLEDTEAQLDHVRARSECRFAAWAALREGMS